MTVDEESQTPSSDILFRSLFFEHFPGKYTHSLPKEIDEYSDEFFEQMLGNPYL